MATDEERKFGRWPLLLAAITLTGFGLALDLRDPTEATFAETMVALGAASFGAFLYAEGARHREWWHRLTKHDNTDQEET